MKTAFLSVVGLLFSGVLASPQAEQDEVDSPVKSTAVCGPAFKYFGVSQSGAELNNNSLPGRAGSDYAWPSAASADFFFQRGFNTIRIPFLMERLTSGSRNNLTLRGEFGTEYFFALKQAVDYVTSKGAYAVLDPHNYMTFNGTVIRSINEFKLWWGRFAGEFRGNSRVVFEVMNSPLDVDSYQAADLNQAAVDGIRGAGALSQLILIEGANRSYASTWVSSRNAEAAERIDDPQNNLAVAMRQGLDADGTARSSDCLDPQILIDRLRSATEWLARNGQKGFLVEFASGSSPTCISALQNALCAMQQTGVWVGATWWAAGPLWGNYFSSIEPPNGPAVNTILPQALLPFI